MAGSDSSYFLVIFPVKNEKMRICRSGKENVINDAESGERVIHVGVDFDWKKKDIRENGPTSEDERTEDGVAGAHLLELIQVGLSFE
jgi:hypothetical protein